MIDRKELVEKMRKAWDLDPMQGMDAALSVAIEELLPNPSNAELDAVEHSWTFAKMPAGIFYTPSDVAQKVRDAACIFNSNRRAQLERVKTPEETMRVGILYILRKWAEVDSDVCEDTPAEVADRIMRLIAKELPKNQ